jgi:hypothetical protein
MAHRDRYCAATKCPLSGGEFNWSVQHQSQSIGWGFEAEGLSRALVEPQGDASIGITRALLTR